jgi:hypothetical protein
MVAYAIQERARSCPGVYGQTGEAGSHRHHRHERALRPRDREPPVGGLRNGPAAGTVRAAERYLATLSQRGQQIVSYAGWNAIEQHELCMGETQRSPRVKLVRHDDLLACAPSAATGQPREE